MPQRPKGIAVCFLLNVSLCMCSTATLISYFQCPSLCKSFCLSLSRDGLFLQEGVLHRLRSDPQSGALRHGRPEPHQAGGQQDRLPPRHHPGLGEPAGVLGWCIPGLHRSGGLWGQEPTHHHSGSAGEAIGKRVLVTTSVAVNICLPTMSTLEATLFSCDLLRFYALSALFISLLIFHHVGFYS